MPNDYSRYSTPDIYKRTYGTEKYNPQVTEEIEEDTVTPRFHN